jgi:hypothetical protein
MSVEFCSDRSFCYALFRSVPHVAVCARRPSVWGEMQSERICSSPVRSTARVAFVLCLLPFAASLQFTFAKRVCITVDRIRNQLSRGPLSLVGLWLGVQILVGSRMFRLPFVRGFVSLWVRPPARHFMSIGPAIWFGPRRSSDPMRVPSWTLVCSLSGRDPFAFRRAFGYLNLVCILLGGVI